MKSWWKNRSKNRLEKIRIRKEKESYEYYMTEPVEIAKLHLELGIDVDVCKKVLSERLA